MFDRERPSFEDSNNVTVKRCFFAYEWAIQFLKGKETADIGCADGYGTQFLANYTKNTIGVDYSEATIELARNQHKEKLNLSFISGKVPPLPLETESRDVVTAFQFIEHIHPRKAFMEDVKRVLRPGGVFLCTTPNNKMSIARNPFHVHEYTFEEMKNEASQVFDKIELYGVQGNQKVNNYYEENSKWAKKILRLDPLGIHKMIPSSWLVAPYNFLTSIMRKDLKETNQDTLKIETSDFHLTQESLDNTWDIVLVAYKK
ncbi:MAG: class I SAM-dependent methyltransferase [Bacteroidia bacterium]|nr:class I SAM-dependent methyltransferase [Bacteroidia bacterium]MCF8428220.1 class I SAM-dependent methyltransferase [Bacteroidia bacterium]MCF8447605.1 class I SAM-dependent methyltransferase [Bacteroidia bacterium]